MKYLVQGARNALKFTIEDDGVQTISCVNAEHIIEICYQREDGLRVFLPGQNARGEPTYAFFGRPPANVAVRITDWLADRQAFALTWGK